MAGNPKFQSSLGTVFERRYKDGSNIDKISFARVTKVNYRYNTVDIQSVRGDFATNTSGRLSAQLPIQFGGTTKEGKVFGQVNPIEVGTYVLVGFVEGKKSSPVVLAVYGGEDESQNLSRTPFEEADPSDEELKQLTQQQFTVYPSLTYDNIDGEGNRTVSFTGKSFVTTEAGANPEVGGLTDDAEGTAYEDLDSSYYYSGELIEPKENRAPVILFKHQGDKFARNEQGFQEGSHTFMWFLDDDGTYRTSMMQEDEDWRAYFEMTPDGKIQMVRQNDSKTLNSSTDRYSIGVEDGGIRIRVGDRYSLITPDGTYGNLGLGAGGGSGSIPQDVLDRIDATLDLANRKILQMDTYMVQTDAFISMGANMLEEIEGGMKQYKADFTILAEEIRTSVSETVLRDLLNEELNAFIGDIEELSTEAKEQINIIMGLIEDGKLTPSEKAIMIPGYQNIKIEYPTYIEQAEKNGRDSTRLKAAYEHLVEVMEPILSKPDEISTVNPIEVKEVYEEYYNRRQELISGILFELQKDVMELAEKTSKVATDAADALVESSNAMTQAKNALSSLTNIADTNKVTPQEKQSLRREIDRIKNEFEGYLGQATEYDIPKEAYENAYNTLISFVDSNEIFKEMGTTSEINGQYLYDSVETYYKERINIINKIAKENSEQLKELHTNFETHQTAITETSKEISLVAKSVIATEESIRVALARLSVMSDRIQSTVSSTTFKREIDENRNTLNATGRNLYVKTTTTKGSTLDPNTGETTPTGQGETSAPIRVSGGAMYTGSVYNNTGTNTMIIAYYDGNMKFISSNILSISSGDEYKEIMESAPSNAKIARVSVDNGSVSDVQFERGASSKYYMYSNEDLINDLEYATKEKVNREIAWKDKYTRMVSKSNEDSTFRLELGAILANEPVSKEGIQQLIDEVDYLDEGYKLLIQEATDLGIQTINIEMAMSALKSVKDQYLLPIISGDKTDLTASEKDQVEKRFDEYLTRRGKYYEQVNDRFKTAYEAAVEVLDDVLAGSLEAERIAREAAIAAEKAAQNVASLEIQMAEGNQMESRHLIIVNRISEDGVLTPIEKEEGITLKKEIDDEIDWLMAQGLSIGLSTNDLSNAYDHLDSEFSKLTTPSEMLKNSDINAQSFNSLFENYHIAKLTFIGNLLKEAKGTLKDRDEEAKLTRDETLRRDGDLQVIKNIISDSELAIQRIEEKVEVLERTHAYSIELLSTNGFTFKDRIIDTTLKVTVRQGTEDITKEIPARNFEWTKTRANGDTDTSWDQMHKDAGPEVQLTHEDVKGRATFTVAVYLDEEDI